MVNGGTMDIQFLSQSKQYNPRYAKSLFFFQNENLQWSRNDFKTRFIYMLYARICFLQHNKSCDEHVNYTTMCQDG